MIDVALTPDNILKGLLGLGIAAMTVWNRLLAAKVNTATSGAEVAKADGDRAVALAGETVFNLVSQRLQSVEGELSSVREELAKVRDQLRERDNRIHFLEMHIVDLEHCLRQHGIEPPVMRDKV
jgi:hypothetical protein